MVPSPIEPEPSLRLRALRRCLEDFVVDNAGDPLPWIVLPASSVHESRGYEISPIGELSHGSRRLLRELRSSDRIAREVPAQSAKHYAAGGVVFEADGVNHLRTLEGMMQRLGEPRPLEPIHPSRARVARLTLRALRLADRFMRVARGRDVWLFEEPAQLRAVFAAGARFLAHAEALLDAVSPRAVVIPTPPAIPARALVYAARARGVPSIYFPHASTLVDLHYNDLPVDYAGLRGELEAEFYAGWGADRDRLEVVGNPSMPELPLPAMDPSLPAVLAPPSAPREQLVALFQMVHRVLGNAVIISPHPRSDLGLLRAIAPPQWSLWDRRTLELLQRGPPLLCQQSSGVAVEALYLGIPTVNLTLPARPASTYAAIREPYVRTVRSEDELRAAVDAARTDATDRRRRDALRTWARGWSAGGDRTVDRAVALIGRAARDGARDRPILDAWGDPSRRTGTRGSG